MKYIRDLKLFMNWDNTTENPAIAKPKVIYKCFLSAGNIDN